MRWLNTSKKEEVGFSKGIYQLEHLQSEPKSKSKSKDQAISTIVTQHKKEKLQADNYKINILILQVNNHYPENYNILSILSFEMYLLTD